MLKEIESLKKAIYVLNNKIEQLESWCNQHEAEEINRIEEKFEEKDDELDHSLADLGERINLVAKGMLNINKRVDSIEQFLLI